MNAFVSPFGPTEWVRSESVTDRIECQRRDLAQNLRMASSIVSGVMLHALKHVHFLVQYLTRCRWWLFCSLDCVVSSLAFLTSSSIHLRVINSPGTLYTSFALFMWKPSRPNIKNQTIFIIPLPVPYLIEKVTKDWYMVHILIVPLSIDFPPFSFYQSLHFTHLLRIYFLNKLSFLFFAFNQSAYLHTSGR